LAVNINLLGTEYNDSENSGSGAQASSKAGISGVNNTVQSNTVMITPSVVVVSELAPLNKKAVSSSQASLGNNVIAAVPGNNLVPGTQFRVIAYKSSDGSYKTHQDYTTNTPPAAMKLDHGVSYEIVVYSFNAAAALPAISTSEKTNISSAQVNYSDTNRDFLYQRISNFTPLQTVPNNVINIKLGHKLTELTTVVKTATGTISTITNARITPHFTTSTVALSSGAFTRTGTAATASVAFGSASGTTITSTPTYVNGSGSASFLADITMESGPVKSINLANKFTITPGNQQSLTFNVKRCGAMLGTTFREFSCHNVGADTTADPFTAAASIHGAKYKWGYETGGAGYISQADDQANSGVISSWTGLTYYPGWADGSKGPRDPCPSGYRVPTQAELTALIAPTSGNTISRVGTNWTASPTNYTTGLKIGDNLFLPAAGYRNGVNGNGVLVGRGSTGRYWSGTTGDTDPRAYRLDFTSTTTSVIGGFLFNSKFDGNSVRCISEVVN
ncbi:TPA: hypothetical protein ACWX1I_003727, partial [Elizabethkingia anophelis]